MDLQTATKRWKDTLNEVFFASKDTKDALSDKEITEEQTFDLELNSKEMAKFIFGEEDYLGYKDPQYPYTEADTPGAIFLDIINKEVNPLLEKTPNLKDLTEKKIKAIKKIISEFQQIEEKKKKFNFY